MQSAEGRDQRAGNRGRGQFPIYFEPSSSSPFGVIHRIHRISTNGAPLLGGAYGLEADSCGIAQPWRRRAGGIAGAIVWHSVIRWQLLHRLATASLCPDFLARSGGRRASVRRVAGAIASAQTILPANCRSPRNARFTTNRRSATSCGPPRMYSLTGPSTMRARTLMVWAFSFSALVPGNHCARTSTFRR